MVEHHLV